MVGHQHGERMDASGDSRWLAAALAVILVFMLGEAVVGLVAGSLALLSDAAHMLTDAASIALALAAMRLAARPAAGRMTYGWHRVEILSAQANGVTLVLLALWLSVEAVRRLVSPAPVTGALVLVTALVGIVVDIVTVSLISRARRGSLNVAGAFAHVVTDLYAFVATAVAGAVVLTTGFVRADALATLVVVALLFRAGFSLVRASSRIFLEAAPSGLDPAVIGPDMAARDGVVEVHDLHIWEITSGQPALSAHVLVEPGRDCHGVRADLADWLAAEHHLRHVTLQVDHVPPRLLELGGATHCVDEHGPRHRHPDQPGHRQY